MDGTSSQNDHPNYYSVIPADVRYDKELKANEKLLYGEISALANKTGECWATNAYFSKLYDVSIDRVRIWIRNLESKGYISTRIEYEGKQVKARYISIVPSKTWGGVNEIVGTSPHEKMGTPPHEKMGDNITRDNTIKENNKYITEVAEIIDYLNTQAGKRYRTESAQSKHIRARLSEGYTVEDCKKVIDIKVKEWLGNDMEKYLRPETLFNSTKFENYINQGTKPRKDIGKVWE